MEKMINIDIKQIDDLSEKYNDDVVSKDLIHYILNQAKFVNRKEKISINIDLKFQTDIDIIDMIKKSIRKEYLLNLKRSYINDIRQIFFLLFGIICLFLSTVIKHEIVKEIILIGGWILIWEMIDLQLFSDTQLKRDKMILKKILNSQIIINKKAINDF